MKWNISMDTKEDGKKTIGEKIKKFGKFDPMKDIKKNEKDAK